MSRILIFIFLVTAAYIVLKALQGIFRSMKSKRGPQTRSVAGEVMVQDPVCGIYIPRSRAIEGRLQGLVHYFCSAQCLEKYRSGAEREEP